MLHVISFHSQFTLPSYVPSKSPIPGASPHFNHDPEVTVTCRHGACNKQAWGASQVRPGHISNWLASHKHPHANPNKLLQNNQSYDPNPNPYPNPNLTLVIINSYETCYINALSNFLTFPYFAGQFIIIFQCSFLYITTLNHILLTASFTMFYCVADLTDMTCCK